MDKIDSFDLKILKLIQENNKITSEVLAKKVGLSSSACQRRINSMRKAGIIQKDVSIINRNVLGRKITIVVQVLSDKEGVEYSEEFKKIMIKAPEVMQCSFKKILAINGCIIGIVLMIATPFTGDVSNNPI